MIGSSKIGSDAGLARLEGSSCSRDAICPSKGISERGPSNEARPSKGTSIAATAPEGGVGITFLENVCSANCIYSSETCSSDNGESVEAFVLRR